LEEALSVTVYTANIGGYDEVLAPPASPESTYLCYTDSCDEIPRPWESLRIAGLNPNWPAAQKMDLDTARAVRIHKTLSHLFAPGDYSIWIDANFQLAADPCVLCEQHLITADIALFAHPWRLSYKAEADALIADGFHDAEPIRLQAERYREAGCPEGAGLYCGGVILRRHTPRIAAFNELWWAEVLSGSARDQLSLPYALWRCGIQPVIIPGSIYESKEFLFHDHIPNRRHAEDQKRSALDTRSDPKPKRVMLGCRDNR